MVARLRVRDKSNLVILICKYITKEVHGASGQGLRFSTCRPYVDTSVDAARLEARATKARDRGSGILDAGAVLRAVF